MLYRREDQKDALIHKLARQAAAAREKSGGEIVERFVSQFYANVAPEDMLSASEEELLGAALTAWKYFGSRPADKPKVRVFNPTKKKDGWISGHTVIEIINDDMPFLVDSVTAELNRHNLTVHLTVHPVMHVQRDKTGRLTRLFEGGEDIKDASSESVMHIQINEQTLPENLRLIHDRLTDVLADVRASVEHWRSMRVRVADSIAELDSSPPPLPAEEIEEAKSFLRWVEDNHFTFLGYREYDFTGAGDAPCLQVAPRSGLGILRKSEVMLFEGLRGSAEMPPDIADFIREPSLLIVGKANRRSTVHRSAPLDTIGIKKFDKAGEVIGERLFAGLFTSDVYSQAVGEIPLLRRKVENIVARSGFPPASHDGKALLHILETLPRDELLQVGEDDLLATSMGVLHLQERQRVALFVHRDPFGRHVTCLVYVPRDRYDTQMRETMHTIIEEGFGSPVTAYYTQVTESALARLHFIVETIPGKPTPLTTDEIEARLIEAGRGWRDDLSHELIAQCGEARGLDQFRIYSEAFPSSYREQFDPEIAVADVAKIDAVLESRDVGMNLYCPSGAAEREFRFKLYHCDTPVPLSDVLPMLENMGVKVIDEVPHRITPVGADCGVWVHDFGLLIRSGNGTDLATVKPLFEDAFARIWAGQTEDDGFNKLVLMAGLDWRRVVVLRAYCKFLLQAAIPFSQAYMEETLSGNPAIARMIVDLFETLLDPSERSGAEDGCAKLRAQIDEALNDVAVLDEDRILRRYVNAVESTLRTNYYQMGADGGPKPYLSFKLDSQSVDELPLPRPAVEIFVHSPRVDAVHLRGGRIARGGIRWSDRREDFRTEILGLMKSQMTKNAVIVPVGAKGGFVVKRAPEGGGREALLEEGVACYKTMMRGMLDITDNLKSGKIVAPKDVVRRDGDDPYLVVAADKGTATFSDIANGIAAEYGFWLDDAFASGGSVGYDHKVMGITARGAWESVKRHFREMEIDTQATDFTCVGVGDMSGDVFGNGMLNSKHIKLVGAFNHLHIFIDPDPDPAASWRERNRMFKLPRSSWSDYNADLISEGGGVFERSAKSIKVTPRMRQLFELPRKESITPNELIRAMLGAEVDLLWFGGIGTYIKARSEAHLDAGDRNNDAVRLDGRKVRAKVIGEGANLGVTQLGRVEFALAGGRINTDFIDNSAGVGCSDHEVNIKIALGDAMAAGRITMEKRNALLVEMTDEIAELVLMDNYRQSMALTNVEQQSVARLDSHARFMAALERAGKLNRAVEYLPDDETLDQRRADGRGLARPEISVLLAYAKITLFEDLLEAGLCDDPYLADGLNLYFPTPMRKKFADLLPNHRLRREITATYVANSLVNRTGPSFINDIQERTGALPGIIARAYLVCREVYRMAELWAGVEKLDNNVPADVQTTMHLEILDLIKRGTLWFLRSGPRPFPIGATVNTFMPGVEALRARFDEILTPDLKTEMNQRIDDLVARNVPPEFARRIAELPVLAPTCDIVRIAAGAALDPCDVGRIYFGLGSRFGLDWLRGAAEASAEGNEWQKMAIAGVIDDLYSHQAEMTTKVLDTAGDAAIADAVIDTWCSAHDHAVERVLTTISEQRTSVSLDLAMLSVANRAIRSLVEA